MPLASLLQLGCGEGEYITLGQTDPRPRFLDSGRLIRNINSSDNDDNPTLTQDMKEIYFTSDREGSEGTDVYFATRTDRSEPFGLPTAVDAANTDADETSAAISPDGMTLWVGSKRAHVPGEDDEDNNDIWVLTRPDRESPWGTPTRLSGVINSDKDDIPRPLGLNGTVMPIASKRDNDDDYETFLARLADGEFSSELEPIPEISEQGAASVDAFMTDDGLLLFFNRAEGSEGGELYMAWRREPNDPFIETLPLDGVNGGDEGLRDPWVNVEGTRFVFASDRGDEGLGGTDIYMAFIELPSFRGSP